MNPVWITGIGYATSLGSRSETVGKNLKEGRTGLKPAQWPEAVRSPVKLWAPVADFDTRSDEPEDWKAPDESFCLPMEVLRSIPVSGFYAFWAVAQALGVAGLEKKQLGDGRSGLYTASAGSIRQTYRHLSRLFEKGTMGCSPLGVISSVVGTLNFNLGAYYGIRGASCGFASACASSGHALGFAADTLAAGSQDTMVVVGAEDDTLETILPFASMRALTMAGLEDFRGPFDVKRSGFVGTGGAVAMILEREESAKARGLKKPLAILRGWGQATDGYHAAKPHPEGAGILDAMKNALTRSGLKASDIEYLNAHATGTAIGDLAEMKALAGLFDEKTAVSSTKGLTGHGLSLASIMELALTIQALKDGYCPGTYGLKELDSAAKGVNYLKENLQKPTRYAMSNSSGFGGANVSLVVENA